VPLPPWPTVPNPSTWSSGPILVPRLRADVTNAVSFLANKPSFLGFCTSAPAVPTGGSGSLVTLDSEAYDSWQGHQPLGNQPGWYLCRAPGWYLAEGYISWSYNTATTVSFTTSLAVGTGPSTSPTITTGEIHPVNDTRTPGPMAADLVQLVNAWTPGTTLPVNGSSVPDGMDYIALYARQNSGSNQNLTAAATQYPRLSVRWMCANTGTTGLSVPSNPSWPVPPAYITSAGYLNPAIRDTIRFLAYPPIFRALYAAGTNTLTSQTFPAASKLALDTVTVDNYSGWSAANNYWVAPVAGVYYCIGQVHVAAQASAGSLAAGFSVNAGTTVWGKSARSPSNSSGFAVATVKRLRLNAGDTVALMGSNSNSSALTINSGTRLVCCWESS
jgi:hypothetical protein